MAKRNYDMQLVVGDVAKGKELLLGFKVASVQGNERTEQRKAQLREEVKAIKAKPVAKKQPVALDAWQRELQRLGF